MAKFLRIKPKEWYDDIALRMEVFGCMRGKLILILSFADNNSNSTPRILLV